MYQTTSNFITEEEFQILLRIVELRAQWIWGETNEEFLVLLYHCVVGKYGNVDKLHGYCGEIAKARMKIIESNWTHNEPMQLPHHVYHVIIPCPTTPYSRTLNFDPESHAN